MSVRFNALVHLASREFEALHPYEKGLFYFEKATSAQESEKAEFYKKTVQCISKWEHLVSPLFMTAQHARGLAYYMLAVRERSSYEKRMHYLNAVSSFRKVTNESEYFVVAQFYRNLCQQEFERTTLEFQKKRKLGAHSMENRYVKKNMKKILA